MSTLTDSPEWQALVKHQASTSHQTISSLFAENLDRFSQFSLETEGLLLDFSKNLLDTTSLDLLITLAEKAQLRDAIGAMFAGDNINFTEDLPALHVALRSPLQSSEYEQQVHHALDRMESLVKSVTSWEWKGCTGQPITNVVNIGIGGSDLGPAMVYSALSNFHLDGIQCHFVSNVDPVHLEQTLKPLDPATTLFVIASKSFTTLETSLNVETARDWFIASNPDVADLAKHFVAVTTNQAKAEEFGIAAENIFPMWDWVGGRYSLWSAIGLPIALGTGMDNFRALLSGAHVMDKHFQNTNLKDNIPVILGLLDIWQLCIFGATNKAILPYSQNLHLLPAWMQQLNMESLGKSVGRDGSAADYSGGVIWGGTGTNGQHSFHQFLHQGNKSVPVDFVAIAKTESENSEQHEQLLANCFAQSRVLMSGMESDDPHKTVPDNKPSNTIVLDELLPETLGSLLAAYEHSVYVQSVLLGINAFDQWGVEAGKTASAEIYSELTATENSTTFDPSTNALINYCKKL